MNWHIERNRKGVSVTFWVVVVTGLIIRSTIYLWFWWSCPYRPWGKSNTITKVSFYVRSNCFIVEMLSNPIFFSNHTTREWTHSSISCTLSCHRDNRETKPKRYRRHCRSCQPSVCDEVRKKKIKMSSVTVFHLPIKFTVENN